MNLLIRLTKLLILMSFVYKSIVVYFLRFSCLLFSSVKPMSSLYLVPFEDTL